MPDGRPPELPATAPIELREFVECKRASVTITSGPLDWLPLPPDIKEYAPTPNLALTPGASAGTGTMTIDLMITSFALPVSIVGGDLQIDASGLSSIPGAQEAIDTWVKDFNDWLKKNGQRLKPTTIAGGSVTLTKEPIPAPPPGVATPPPVPPAPPVAPVTPTPPAGNANNTGCWLLGLLALLLIGVLGVGAVTGLIPLFGGGGAGPAGSAGSAGSSSSAAPSSSAGATASERPAATEPSAGASSGPSATASVAAPGASSAPPVAPPPPRAAPALLFLQRFAGMTTDDLSKLVWHADPAGDWYFPQPGQTPARHPPEIDLTAVTGFVWTLTTEAAAAVTAAIGCETDATLDDGTPYRGACNQATRPLTAGEYVVIATVHAGGYPTDVPSAGLHSWSVYTNADDDPATGFTSTAPGNYLIGADTYFEVVAFKGEAGPRVYILATRVADPVRPDTGQRQGNLATVARAVWFVDDGVQLWFIPRADFGPNWHAGAFATLDRGANSPQNLAADALGGPSDDDWRVPKMFEDVTAGP